MGIGLASVGGLWLTVRCALVNPRRRAALALSQFLRFSLTTAAFYAASREGAGFLLAALAGFLVAREIVILRWGVWRAEE